jgi:hypothetical protein
MNSNYLIVVGVDGSEGGRRALRWECIRRASCPVVVIPVPADQQEPAAEPALRT